MQKATQEKTGSEEELISDFRPETGEPHRMKTWSGQRLLGRALAIPFDYAELFHDPEAARRGEFDPFELLAKTTCATNGGEDDS
jgi:hypothetical protein